MLTVGVVLDIMASCMCTWNTTQSHLELAQRAKATVWLARTRTCVHDRRALWTKMHDIRASCVIVHDRQASCAIRHMLQSLVLRCRFALSQFVSFPLIFLPLVFWRPQSLVFDPSATCSSLSATRASSAPCAVCAVREPHGQWEGPSISYLLMLYLCL